MAPDAIHRAAIASVTTAAESDAAPTHAPGKSVVRTRTTAVADIAASRIIVPVATSRVRPERINTPCTNRRIPMAAGHGRNSHNAP